MMNLQDLKMLTKLKRDAQPVLETICTFRSKIKVRNITFLIKMARHKNSIKL